MREILPHSSMLSLMLRGNFIEDEILHAARHILENHKVPIRVSLAFQVQHDIQRLGSVSPIKTLDGLRASFQITKSRRKEHQKWSKSLGFQVWDKDAEDHIGWIDSHFRQWIEGSKCGKADGEDYKRRA